MALNWIKRKHSIRRSYPRGSFFDYEGSRNKQYKFDMSPSTGVQHDGFTVRISNLQSSGDVDYMVNVYENGESFTEKVLLKRLISLLGQTEIAAIS